MLGVLCAAEVVEDRLHFSTFQEKVDVFSSGVSGRFNTDPLECSKGEMFGEMFSGQPFQDFDEEVPRAFRRENKPEQQSFGLLTGTLLMPSDKAYGGVVPEEGAADVKDVNFWAQALHSKDK